MLTKGEKQKLNKIFLYLFTGVISIGFSFLAILTTAFPFYTADDSSYLPSFLEKANRPSVLGANTEEELRIYGCSKEKPVIGWIDYKGNKVIKESLPLNESASACFKNLEEAKKEGFKVE
jgi:hypothetical protein